MSPSEGTTLEGIDLWLGQPGKNPDRYQKSGRKTFVRDLLMSNLDECAICLEDNNNLDK